MADPCESSFTMHWHAVYDKWYLYSPLWRKYNWNSLLHHLGSWSCNMAVAPAHRHTIYNCSSKQLWNMCLFLMGRQLKFQKNLFVIFMTKCMKSCPLIKPEKIITDLVIQTLKFPPCNERGVCHCSMSMLTTYLVLLGIIIDMFSLGEGSCFVNRCHSWSYILHCCFPL